MKYLLTFLLGTLMISCSESSQSRENESDQGSGDLRPMFERVSTVEDIPEYDFAGLEPIFEKRDDNIYVINFWATWCKPCVAELPYFEQLHEDYRDSHVKVVLVSLDFPHQIESKLLPFIQDNKIQSEVVLLDDPDANAWIDAVDRSWSGAIPATLVYNRSLRQFYEQSFHSYSELESIVKPLIQ